MGRSEERQILIEPDKFLSLALEYFVQNMDKYEEITDKGPLGKGAYGVAKLLKRKSDQKLFVVKIIDLEGLNVEDAYR